MDDDDREAQRRALGAVRQRYGRARFRAHLPEEERDALTIIVGGGGRSEDEGADEERTDTPPEDRAEEQLARDRALGPLATSPPEAYRGRGSYRDDEEEDLDEMAELMRR